MAFDKVVIPSNILGSIVGAIAKNGCILIIKSDMLLPRLAKSPPIDINSNICATKLEAPNNKIAPDNNAIFPRISGEICLTPAKNGCILTINIDRLSATSGNTEVTPKAIPPNIPPIN